MNTPLHFGASNLRPVLVLGLIGFTDVERSHIESHLNLAPVGGVRWRIGAFGEADAWLANGSRTQLLADDEVCVDAAAGDDAPVRLWLPQVDRPIAFSRPVASDDFEPACTFALDSSASLIVALAKFSQWLRPRAILMYLADLLTQHMGRIRKSRVYHLLADYRLVAVVDLKADVGVLPEATLGDIAGAAWLPRPDSAGFVPGNFARRGTRELMWEYGSRTEREVLPARYRAAPLFLRRAPLLAQRLLSDAQLFVLRELAREPHSFAQLCASAKFSAGEIGRALTSLYLVGSITSSPERAAAMQRREPAPSSWPWFMSSQHESAPALQDLTAPGVLPIY